VVLIGIVMPVMEGSAPWLLLLDRVGIPTLLLNGAVAFALNIAGVFLIDSAGSVVLTLSGVFKVGWAAILFAAKADRPIRTFSSSHSRSSS
jgi:hypothetical protein